MVLFEKLLFVIVVLFVLCMVCVMVCVIICVIICIIVLGLMFVFSEASSSFQGGDPRVLRHRVP